MNQKMHKAIGAVALLLLGLALTANAADVTLQDDGNGGYYVDMTPPLESENTRWGYNYLTIPDDVKSFKVYDDGGKDGNYGLPIEKVLNSNLVLSAPEGMVMLLKGSFKLYENAQDRVSFYYDEPDNILRTLDRYGNGTIDMMSTGNKLQIYFHSDLKDEMSETDEGLDLTVTLIKSNYAALTVAGINGKKAAVIDGTYNGTDAFKIDDDIDVDTVVLNRTFSTNEDGYSTLMLPFDVNVSEIEGLRSAIEFTEMTTDEKRNPAVGMSYVWCDDETQANLKQIAEDKGESEYEHCNDDGYTDGVLYAYTPYMIKAASPNLRFKNGVKLLSTPVTTEVRRGDWVFRGTTEKKVWTKKETKDGNVWAYAAKVQDAAQYVGQFVKLGAGAYAQPFRAYMVKEPLSKPSAPASKGADNVVASLSTDNVNPEYLPIVIVSRDNGEKGDEHTTVIGKIDARTGEYHWDYRAKRTYDLKGRNVGKPKAKGFYLKK